jgi:hypothetical protein
MRRVKEVDFVLAQQERQGHLFPSKAQRRMLAPGGNDLQLFSKVVEEVGSGEHNEFVLGFDPREGMHELKRVYASSGHLPRDG